MTRAADKIKVMFFYPNEFLGPEMTVYSQALRHMDRERFVPYLILSEGADGNTYLGENDDVVIRRWKFGQAFRAGMLPALRTGVRIPLELLSLARYARREGIDIIHCAATPRASTMGMILAKLVGARLLLHYHVLPGRYGGPRGFMERVIARRAHHSVAVSEFLLQSVRELGIPASRASVVVNGVNCRKFNPDVDGADARREYGIAPDAPLIVQLARIIQQKRQEDVVRAFALARQRVPNLRCLLVGWEDPRYDGPFASYKAELEHIAAEAGLADSLIMSEARADAAPLVAAADMIVMPSVGDAWNLAVTEAMAAGKPVIGSASGGIPEQVVEGVTGYLVPLYDVEALATRIVTLAQDPALRGQMGAAAHRRATSLFDERFVAAGFAPIYEKLARHENALPGPVPVRSEA
jgi:glycosyltransferase involved in cell wall biosynthesis